MGLTGIFPDVILLRIFKTQFVDSESGRASLFRCVVAEQYIWAAGFSLIQAFHGCCIRSGSLLLAIQRANTHRVGGESR